MSQEVLELENLLDDLPENLFENNRSLTCR